MKEEQQNFLARLGQPPARLTTEQTAWVLNCQPHDIPILVAGRLLKPLGNPPANGIKFFATSDVLEQIKDRIWLTKVTTAIYGHWQKQNAARRSRLATNSPSGATSSTGEGVALTC